MLIAALLAASLLHAAPQAEAVAPNPHFRSGQEALGHSQWAAAEREFRLAVADAPEDAQAHRGLGIALLRLNRAGEAADVLERAATLQSGLPGIHFLAGLAQFASGRLPAAINSFELSLKQRPDDRNALLYLARAYAVSGQPDRAVPAVSRVLQHTPNDPEALLLMIQFDPSRAGQFGKRLVEVAPDSYQAHMWLAMRAQLDNNPQQAVDEYQAAIRKAPELTAGLHFELARAYTKMADYDRACNALQDELRVNPYSGASYLLLGTLLILQGKFAEAIAPLESALKLNHRPAEANLQLGKAYAKQRQFERARTLLEEAIHLAPALPEAHYELSAVYARLGRREDAAAQMRAFDELKAKQAAPPPVAPSRTP